MAPHEFTAHLLFTEYGRGPFFACDRRIKDGGGSQRGEFNVDGETWEMMLSYRSSGLAHPGKRLPPGTEFQLDEMHEFSLRIESADDPVGERSFHAHIASRWQGMTSEARKFRLREISTKV